MENAMSRRKGKKLIIFIGIAIFIVLLNFLKMKYGIYGKNDWLFIRMCGIENRLKAA